MRLTVTISRRFALAAALAGVLVAGALVGALLAGPAKARQKHSDWAWLEGTTWIVPPSGLPALSFDSDAQLVSPTQDQTVYRITGYRNGYFWGPTAIKIGEEPVTCRSLIGSVTPEGDLLLLFSQSIEGGPSTLQTGWGRMERRNGEWTMLNQTGAVSIAHWAYMVQSRPGDPTWTSLPWVNVPVEAFLGQCPDGPQPAE